MRHSPPQEVFKNKAKNTHGKIAYIQGSRLFLNPFWDYTCHSWFEVDMKSTENVQLCNSETNHCLFMLDKDVAVY